MICMKNIGQQAKAFREAKGWSYTRMAEEVSKHHTETVSRQLITQLEKAGDRKPRYLRALAMAMGTTADALLSGLDEFAPQEPGGPAKVAESPAPSYDIPNLTAAVSTLTQHLAAISPNTRERAAPLLSNMARDPSGPWAEWLISLLTGEAEQHSGTTTIGTEDKLHQNGSLDLSTYPGLKNATEWRRSKNNGDGDTNKAAKKQSGNSS